MKVSALKQALSAHARKTLRFVLPTGTKLPLHAHVTELARLDKRFVDCGGTHRTESTCRLQTWFADDTEHRLHAGKLAMIFELGDGILGGDDLEVEVEHEAPFISHFPIESVEPQGNALVIRLGLKHTACLAEDKCARPVSGPETISFKAPPKQPGTSCCG